MFFPFFENKFCSHKVALAKNSIRVTWREKITKSGKLKKRLSNVKMTKLWKTCSCPQKSKNMFWHSKKMSENAIHVSVVWSINWVFSCLKCFDLFCTKMEEWGENLFFDWFFIKWLLLLRKRQFLKGLASYNRCMRLV